MDKIEYTKNDINFLLEWRDKNKELVRMGLCPIKAIKILSKENGITLTCIRKDRIVHISITQLGRSLGAITFECIPMGLCKIVKNTTKKLQNDDVQSVITVYASTSRVFIIFSESIIIDEYPATFTISVFVFFLISREVDFYFMHTVALLVDSSAVYQNISMKSSLEGLVEILPKIIEGVVKIFPVKRKNHETVCI